MAAEVVADPNVPGLYTATEKVIRQVRAGSWKFALLKDGSVFATEWRGSPEAECMVSHALFSPADVKALAGIFPS